MSEESTNAVPLMTMGAMSLGISSISLFNLASNLVGPYSLFYNPTLVYGLAVFGAVASCASLAGAIVFAHQNAEDEGPVNQPQSNARERTLENEDEKSHAHTKSVGMDKVTSAEKETAPKAPITQFLKQHSQGSVANNTAQTPVIPFRKPPGKDR